MKQRLFSQVDVFSSIAYKGNPVAVVHDADDLSTEDMQNFARWTNLSETTFLLAPTHPDADYRLRIFTPKSELPFAGHPTLGTCHAYLRAGGASKDAGVVVQQSLSGLVRVQLGPHQRLAFAAPPLHASTLTHAQTQQVLKALGLSSVQVLASQMLDNGPLWCALWLDSADTVLELQPDHRALKAFGIKVGVAAGHSSHSTGTPVLIARSNREAHAFVGAESEAVTIEVRAFAASDGIDEDPVTGSLNASLAQWLMGAGLLPKHYTAMQGSAVGCQGHVYLNQDDKGQVWVGGVVQDCVSGSVLV